jgi:hypothetical protein
MARPAPLSVPAQVSQAPATPVTTTEPAEPASPWPGGALLAMALLAGGVAVGIASGRGPTYPPAKQ